MSNNIERNSERNTERNLERHESLDGSEKLTAPLAPTALLTPLAPTAPSAPTAPLAPTALSTPTAPLAPTVTRDIFTTCPHCGGMVHIPATQINCNVFRHAFFKSTGLQIDPHTPKLECDRLLHEDLIWGCGKPFRLELELEQNRAQDQIEKTYHATKCEYI